MFFTDQNNKFLYEINKEGKLTLVNNFLISVPKRVRLKIKGGNVVQDCDIYIGRRFTMGGWNLQESIFANPYRLKECSSREECLEKYKNYLLSRNDLLQSLSILSGKTIGCFCELNEKCHGDILIDIGKQFKYW